MRCADPFNRLNRQARPAATAAARQAGWPPRWAQALAGAGVLAMAGACPAIAAEKPRTLVAGTAANEGQLYPADASGLPVRTQSKTPPAAVRALVLDPVQTAALYYYAKERQIDRVEAEIARLQVLYPGFLPPQDIYIAAERNAPDETNLWSMFAGDDFTGVDAEIIRRKAENPGWEPTLDFQTKLGGKKLRVRMKELTVAEDWPALAAISVRIDPATEPDVDLVWMSVDALSAAGDREGLTRALRGLLLRDGKQRLADEHLVVTLQKALRDFPASEIRLLAATLWPGSSAGSLPSGLLLDLARREVAEFNASKDSAPPSPDLLRRLTADAGHSHTPGDLSLLGWHALKIEDPQAAEGWFTVAMEVAPDPENAKGLYLSLARQKREARAYEFAAAHLDDLADDPVFLMNVLSPRFGKPGDGSITSDAVRAYSTAILETGAADHAEILGWYAYNSRQFEAAEAWFRKALGWEVSVDRIKGLALTLVRLDRKKDFAALRQEFAATHPDIWREIAAAPAPGARNAASVDGPAPGVKSSYVRHFDARNYSACLRDIDRLGAGAARPAVAVIRGWCELGLKRFGDARRSFEAAMASSGQVRADAIYGAALALLGARLTDEAEALITAWPPTPARERELRSEIYVQRARASFDNRRFDRTLAALDARAQLVSEPRDLTQMRAWAYYHMGQTERAKAVFRQLNRVIRDTDSLAAIELINGHEGR